MKTSWTVLELWNGHDFNTTNFKGAQFRKYCTQSYNSFVCISSNHDLHLNKVSLQYIEPFKSYGADTISILIITKENNSVNITHRVLVLVLCTSSNIVLHFDQVS